VEELAEVVRKAEGGKRGRSGSHKGSPLTFPSLCANVVPVEKYGELEPFVLPSDVQVHVQRGENEIDTALATIIDCVPVEADENLVIGFDAEWNVRLEDNGRFERGAIAIVQIAFEKRVEILQVRTCLSQY